MAKTSAPGPMGPRRMPGASPEIIEQARFNCASRLTDAGEEAESDAFLAGERDHSWAMFHEITKILKEEKNGGLG